MNIKEELGVMEFANADIVLSIKVVKNRTGYINRELFLTDNQSGDIYKKVNNLILLELEYRKNKNVREI